MKVASVDEQYNKYSELKKSEVEKFIEWTRQQKHLPVIEELSACCFLHACKFSLEVAKQTYDLWCTTRTAVPEFFSNRDPTGKELMDAMKTIAIYDMPIRTPEGYKLYFCRLADTTPSSFNFAATVKLFSMIIEMNQHEEGVVDGLVLVFDLKGSQLGHMARASFMQLKKFVFFLTKTPPIRMQAIHYVNPVSFMDKLLGLVSPFASKEIMDQLQVHTKLEDLHKKIPKDCLPTEYGGTSGYSMDKSYPELYDRMKENRDYFLEEEKTCRNKEELREGKPKDASELFGIEGNFKKLDID